MPWMVTWMADLEKRPCLGESSCLWCSWFVLAVTHVRVSQWTAERSHGVVYCDAATVTSPHFRFASPTTKTSLS